MAVLPSVLEKYHLNEYLAHGGESSIWSVTRISDKKEFVLKISNIYQERYLREWEILSSLSHGNIVKVVDKFVDGEKEDHKEVKSKEGFSRDKSVSPCKKGINIVLEKIPGSDMFDFVISKHSEKTQYVWLCKLYLTQIYNAVKYLHSRGIVHKDIKLENIMVHENRAVLIDFGSVSCRGEKIIEEGMTPVYVSPYILCEKPTFEDFILHDFWSIATALFIALKKQTPFEETDTLQQDILYGHVSYSFDDTKTDEIFRKIFTSAPKNIESYLKQLLLTGKCLEV